MLHGDISNHRKFNIGFRCEETLLIPKRGIFNQLLNKFTDRYVRADVDPDVLSAMNYIYWDTEYSVSLIVDNDNLTPQLEERLKDFPFNHLDNIIRHTSEITMQLFSGNLTYFVTNNTLEKSLVNSRYAVTLEELNEILKRKRVRM